MSPRSRLQTAAERAIGQAFLRAIDYRIDDPADPPPLSPEQCHRLVRFADSVPLADQLVATALRHLVPSTRLGPEQLCAIQDRVHAIFASADPQAAIADERARAFERGRLAADALTPYLGVPVACSTTDLTLDPLEDAAAWMIETLGVVVQQQWVGDRTGVPPLRAHADAASAFHYRRARAAPADVVVLGDFATGAPAAQALAASMTRVQPDLLLYLGDVYFAGRRREIEAHLEAPLEAVLARAETRVLALAGNHELFSAGLNYLALLDRWRAAQKTPQEGPYFTIDVGAVRFVGVDTVWGFDDRVSAGQERWLDQVLARDPRQPRLHVLLTSAEPFTADDAALAPLLAEDLRRHADAGAIDVWLWGNEHRCAIFPPTPATPFLGVNAGHGGHPYQRPSRARLARPAWIEDAPLFPPELAPDHPGGNLGFVHLHVPSDERPALTLRLIDWLGRTRQTVEVSRTPAGALVHTLADA